MPMNDGFITNEVQTASRDSGTAGRDVVLLHGLFGNLEYFEPLAGRLADEYRTHTARTRRSTPTTSINGSRRMPQPGGSLHPEGCPSKAPCAAMDNCGALAAKAAKSQPDRLRGYPPVLPGRDY